VVGESDLSAEGESIVSPGEGSSLEDCRGLPDEARRLSNEPKTFRGLEGDSAVGGDAAPSDPALLLPKRVRSANSGPTGASSGLELRSVPRVRPIPALEEDIRRKSMALASAGIWLVLVG
jgi:hypothetical protein